MKTKRKNPKFRTIRLTKLVENKDKFLISTLTAAPDVNHEQLTVMLNDANKVLNIAKKHSSKHFNCKLRLAISNLSETIQDIDYYFN